MEAADSSPPNPFTFDPTTSECRELLLTMLTAERDARLSDVMQREFKASGLDGWMDTCAALQAQLVAEHTGNQLHTSGHRAWLHGMRTAYLLFPTDARFREIPIQVKFNRRTVGLPNGFFVDAVLTSADAAAAAAAPTSAGGGHGEGAAGTSPTSCASSSTTSLSTVVGRTPFVVISGSLT
jgi:hypothetical protein